MTDKPKYPGKPLSDLADEPDYTQLIGRISASWSLVEHQVCILFSALLRGPPQRSHAAYYAIVSFHARITMLRSILKDETITKKDREKIAAILDTVSNASNKRNKYVHALWLKRDDKIYIAEGLPTNFMQTKKRRVHKKELSEAADEIRLIAHETGEFLIDFTITDPLSLRVRDLPRALRKKPPRR